MAEGAVVALSSIFGAAASVATAGAMFYERSQQARALREQAEYQKRMALKNKELAEDEIYHLHLQTRQLESEVAKKRGKFVAAQVLGYLGQGVDVRTAVPVLQDTFLSTQADIETIRLNAARMARGLRVQAENAEQNAFFQYLAAHRRAQQEEIMRWFDLGSGLLRGTQQFMNIFGGPRA